MAVSLSFLCVVQRVRRSKTALNPQYEDRQEMTCTMRNWETRQQSSFRSHSVSRSRVAPLSSANDLRTMQMIIDDDHHYGPELLLTLVVEILTNHRDDSPAGRRPSSVVRRRTGSSSSSSASSSNPNAPPSAAAAAAAPVQYSIPIADVMVVETYNVRYGTPLNRLNITTISNGLFEFDFHNSNGHDILLAFLQASLSPERILDGSCDVVPPAVEKSWSASSSCLDVDGLTARHLRGRVENETWPEKISRRVGKVVHSLEEMTGTFCDISCCQATATPERREQPQLTSSLCYPELLELDRNDDATTDDDEENVKPQKTKTQNLLHLPSGLSFEADPEMEVQR